MRNCGSVGRSTGSLGVILYSAKFRIADDSSDEFEVRWGLFGREQYLLNGRLLKQYWDLTSLTGRRTFTLAAHTVEIEAGITQEFAGRAYVDGVIRVPELFPQLMRRPRDPKRTLKNFVIWFLIGVVGTFIYREFTRK